MTHACPRRSDRAASRDSPRRRRAGAAWAAVCLGTLLTSATAAAQGVGRGFTLDDAARELSLDEAVAISLEEKPSRPQSPQSLQLLSLQLQSLQLLSL